MKKLFIVILIISFYFSNACGLLNKEEPINPKDYPFLLVVQDLKVYDFKFELSGASEKSSIKKASTASL